MTVHRVVAFMVPVCIVLAASQPHQSTLADADAEIVLPAREVTNETLRLSEEQEADAVHRVKEASAALQACVDGHMNITTSVQDIVSDVFNSADAGQHHRRDLEAEIGRYTQGLLSAEDTEEDTMREEKAKLDGIKLKAKVAKAVEHAKRAEERAEKLKSKAEDEAQKKSTEAAKAKKEFNPAVGFNSGDVSKISTREAKSSEYEAKKLAKHEQQEQEMKRSENQKAAAEAKTFAQDEAVMKAKGEAAKEQAKVLKKDAKSTPKAPSAHSSDDNVIPDSALSEENVDEVNENKGDSVDGSARGGDEESPVDESITEEAERKVESRAVQTSPERLVSKLRGVAHELQQSRQQSRREMNNKFDELRSEEHADIDHRVEEVKMAVNDAKKASKRASVARRILNKTDPEEYGEVASFLVDAEELAHQAEALEDRIFGQARQELDKLWHEAEHDNRKQLRSWRHEWHRSEKKTKKDEKRDRKFVKKEGKLKRKEDKRERKAEKRQEKQEAKAEHWEQRRRERQARREAREEAKAPERARENDPGQSALFGGSFASAGTSLWDYSPFLLVAYAGILLFNTLRLTFKRPSVREQPPLLG